MFCRLAQKEAKCCWILGKVKYFDQARECLYFKQFEPSKRPKSFAICHETNIHSLFSASSRLLLLTIIFAKAAKNSSNSHDEFDVGWQQMAKRLMTLRSENARFCEQKRGQIICID